LTKIKLLISSLFVIGWFFIAQPHANADEITVQVVPADPSVIDTSTVTSPITIQVVANKVEAATTNLQEAAQTQSTSIITTIQSNVPNTDTSTAISIATTQEPIKTAVAEASVKVEAANNAIQAAQSAVQVAVSSQTNVETQTAVVAQAVTTLETATTNVTSTQTTLNTAQEAQPALDAAASCETGSHCVDFYNKNAELGPLHDQIAPTQTAADAAVAAITVAQTAVEVATTNVANQQAAVDEAITVSMAAKAAADESAVTVTTNGVKASAYTYNGGAAPAIPTANVTPVLTTTVPYISANWGNGVVLGVRSDRVIIKYEGTITVPEEAVAVKYAVYSDDGSKLYIDGQLAINNWRDQGSTWSQFSPIYDTTVDKQQDFILWYYENGGGANVTLGWGITRADGTGYWTNPMNTAFATTVVTKDPVLVAAANAASATFVAANQQLTSSQIALATVKQTFKDAQAAVPVTAQAAADAQTAYDTKLAERNAAYQSWQDAVHAANAGAATIAQAQASYNQAQQDLATAQTNLTIQQQNLTNANQNLTIAIQTADSLADTATTKVNEAVTAMTNAAQVTTNYYAEQQRIAAENARIAAEQAAAQAAAEAAAAEARAARAAELAAQAEANRIAAEKAIADTKVAQEKAAAEAKAAEDARIAAEQAAKEAQAAADKAKAEAEIQAAKDAQAKADAEKAQADAAKAEADAKAKVAADAALAEQKAKDEAVKAAQEAANAKAESDKQKTAADKIAADQAAKDQAAKDAKTQADAVIQAQKDAQAKADAQKAADDKAKQDAIGVKLNNPSQLSDTVIKEAPKEVLVPHIQQDVKGVENGGIEFFGTKSAPQVVGEDGKLTPQAPPPGSGLPIPPEAITTQDTFIGQPGGTTFNAPDIAVPVIITPLTGAIASVPGAEAVNKAFVAMSNIGNDMSPVTRKKAKKILVLTIAVAAIRRRFGS
jgi:hypothetical protein